MKYILTRDVTPEECHWLARDRYKRGMVFYSYYGHCYGVISPSGIAMCEVENKPPFFELPRDALKQYFGDLEPEVSPPDTTKYDDIEVADVKPDVVAAIADDIRLDLIAPVERGPTLRKPLDHVDFRGIKVEKPVPEKTVGKRVEKILDDMSTFAYHPNTVKHVIRELCKEVIILAGEVEAGKSYHHSHGFGR